MPQGIKQLTETSENAQLHKTQSVSQLLGMDYKDASVSARTYTQRPL